MSKLKKKSTISTFDIFGIAVKLQFVTLAKTKLSEINLQINSLFSGSQLLFIFEALLSRDVSFSTMYIKTRFM